MKKIWMMVWMGMCVVMLEAQAPVHVVKQGETLYSIARTYSVSIQELVKLNPGLTTSTQVKLGQRINVPGGNTTTTANTGGNKVAARVHTVTKGETVYSVAKKYGITASDIKQWNSLSDLNIKIGQKLVVSKADKQAIYQPINVASTPDTPYREEDPRPRNTNLAEAKISEQPVVEKPKENTAPVVTTSTASTSLRTGSSNPAEYSGIFSQYSVNGYRIKKNRGAANYLADNTSGNQFLAFYNDAETGSIIRVTNMMNRKTIYVKVMGKVPPVDAGREIMLKLSNKAAQELGVVDDKFLVEVASYQVQQ